LPKLQPSPLKYKDLIKKLKKFGINEIVSSGKGSERILIKGVKRSNYRGPQYPVKCHGTGTEISKAVIKAILRRFNIAPEDFWR
jgi:hypothetical protein